MEPIENVPTSHKVCIAFYAFLWGILVVFNKFFERLHAMHERALKSNHFVKAKDGVRDPTMEDNQPPQLPLMPLLAQNVVNVVGKQPPHH